MRTRESGGHPCVAACCAGKGRRRRGRGRVGTLAAVLGMLAMVSSRAMALVDLELRAQPVVVAAGDTVDVRLFAVWDGSGGPTFSGLNVAFTWDSTVLELGETVNSGLHSWFFFGLLPDGERDGLNDSLLDGDAFFQAAAFTEATATAEGFWVATFRFLALADSPMTEIVVEPSLGATSTTQVLRPGNIDVTGALGRAAITVQTTRLSVSDLTIPAGRVADVVASGDIFGGNVLGVTIALEIRSRPGAAGSVVFTPAAGPADVDIVQVGDPWPGIGMFTPFDTNPLPDGTGSPDRNGSVDDNGMLGDESPTTFSGPLSAFPIVAGEDARGTWDVSMVLSDGVRSQWDSLSGLVTALNPGVIVVVPLFDGDGSGTVDLRDYSELSACFTGPLGPIQPPAYSMQAERRCSVYDSDGDGDIDEDDYSAYFHAMDGP